jgi:hypothetical protein
MPPADAAPRRQRCTPEEIAVAIAALDADADPLPAGRWPGTLEGLDQPGLYAWWADPAGATQLSTGLGLELAPGRIYAGLTGATKWPSGKAGTMTLRSRIGGSHLRGTIRGSTFRRTLVAVLPEPLDLCLQAAGRLSAESEHVFSAWMRAHLSVAVYPFAERDALASLEDEVLAILDPPLNLDGMPPTPLRAQLVSLRATLGRRGA